MFRLAYALLYNPHMKRTGDTTTSRPNTQIHSQVQHPESTTAMTNIITNLLNDEAGFIVSAELVLVATIGVLSLIVGLTEVAFNINQELEDVGSAFGSINQTYQYNGVAGSKGKAEGSAF